MVTDGYQIYHGEHIIRQINVESCCTHTNIIYVNKKSKNNHYLMVESEYKLIYFNELPNTL